MTVQIENGLVAAQRRATEARQKYEALGLRNANFKTPEEEISARLDYRLAEHEMRIADLELSSLIRYLYPIRT